MIQKLMNKLRFRKQEDDLDLTKPYNPKNNATMGFKIVPRAYKGWALAVSIAIISLSILPIVNLAITIPLAVKFLGRFG